MNLKSAQLVPDDLLLRALSGDAQAFASIVEAHQGPVFSIAYRMLNNRAQAEDLAQDVFLQLYRKLDAIETLDHLGFWLRRVASNLAIDWLRRAAGCCLSNTVFGEEVAPTASVLVPGVMA